MKIVLVASLCVIDVISGKSGVITSFPPLGLLSLAATIKKSGEEVELFDPNLFLITKKIDQVTDIGAIIPLLVGRILKNGPDVVGFYTEANGYCLELELAEIIKRKNPGCTIVLGGPQASVTGKETLMFFPFVDFVVKGEGENTILLLLKAFPSKKMLAKVPGIFYREGGDVKENPNPPLIHNLDTLPYTEPGQYQELAALTSFPIETGRGCPFNCTFCFNRVLWGNNVRCKSVDRIINEMIHQYTKNGISFFNLTQDTLTARRLFITSLCQELICRKLPFSWGGTAQASTLSSGIIELLVKAGCKCVGIGMESASPKMQRLYKKNLNVEKAHGLILRCLRSFEVVDVSFIIGHPRENRKDIELTLAFILELIKKNVNQLALCHLTAYPATDISRTLKARLKFEPEIHASRHSPFLRTARYHDMFRKYPSIFSVYYLIDRDSQRYLYFESIRAMVVFLFYLKKAGETSLIRRLTRSGQSVMPAFDKWFRYYQKNYKEADEILLNNSLSDMHEKIKKCV